MTVHTESAETRPVPPGDVFATVRRHQSPGLALGYKMIGSGAYAVTLLGHRHPRVVEAVGHQLGVQPTSSRALANPTVAAFVSRLAARFGAPYDHVWLGSDGADAVETATKLARVVTGRDRILAVEGAFHGKTLGALALTWNPVFRRGLGGVLAPTTHLDPTDPAAVARQLPAGRRLGRSFGARLGAVAAGHPDLVFDVRGAGLMWGLELRTAAVAGGVLTGLAERGVLVSPCLSAPRTIRLLPPMVLCDADLDHAMTALDGALDAARPLLEPVEPAEPAKPAPAAESRRDG